MNEELLYNQMYEKTADCGRTQFIRLLMDKERENQQLKDNWNELMEDIPHILEIIEHNKDVIKVTSDEELAIYSLQNKMQELEQGKDE